MGVQNADKEHHEDLRVQLRMEVFRQRYMSSQSPISLYSNALIRLVPVKPVFNTFCTVRRWTGERGKTSVQYPPESPDLTPLHSYLWSDLKNTVHQKSKNTTGPEAQN
jgi:hypothetical protein